VFLSLAFGTVLTFSDSPRGLLLEFSPLHVPLCAALIPLAITDHDPRNFAEWHGH
jgi:hypothetical protein